MSPTVAVVLLFLGLYLFIRHNRAKRAAEVATYAVDANQIQGPPTTYSANYVIGSAPPGVYAGPGTAPTTYAAPNGIPRVYSGNPYNSQPQTAPSTLAYAPNSQHPTQVYPFKGYSSVSWHCHNSIGTVYADVCVGLAVANTRVEFSVCWWLCQWNTGRSPGEGSMSGSTWVLGRTIVPFIVLIIYICHALRGPSSRLGLGVDLPDFMEYDLWFQFLAASANKNPCGTR